MRKNKLLLLLALLMMAVPHSYAKVYESNLNYYDDELSNGESATIDGIVIRVNSGTIEFELGRDWQGYDGANSFTISTALGETITGIEITCEVYSLKGTGWTGKTPGAVWSGSATSVNVGQYFENVTHIKVTVADPVNVTANEGASGEYWSTYYNASTTQGFTADANTTVFQAALSGNQLTMTEVANREIPAGKAVILKSSSSTITLTPATTTATLEGNALQGTATEITNPGNAYVLSKGAKGVGFYKLSSTGTIGANKAYLTYSATAREFFPIEGNVTGIEMPKAATTNSDAEVYDLQGRQVVNPTKGLYIVNGKKVFINK